MCDMIQGRKVKQITLTAELVKISGNVLVQNIDSKKFDEELIELYFTNSKKSGGSDVENVCLLGDGKAIVTFQDPKGNVNSMVVWWSCMAKMPQTEINCRLLLANLS